MMSEPSSPQKLGQLTIIALVRRKAERLEILIAHGITTACMEFQGFREHP